jgi:hypothetical protein
VGISNHRLGDSHHPVRPAAGGIDGTSIEGSAEQRYALPAMRVT